ncbi:MAG: hypothetical protein Q4C37_08395 [Bacteroidales bacterium]|nr:hypothetical protein [Bacteroidales bacterium]
MKTIIKNSIILSAVALGIASCGENSWNDKYLDGFEGGADFSNVQTLDYTFTDADYENLAANSANVDKAKAADVYDDLKALGSLHYFNAAITPAEYIPNFLTDPDFKYFTLSEGSSINITYKIAKNLPEEMIGLNAAKQWSLSEEDYMEVYGSEENYAPAFSPSHSAANYLPNMLGKQYPNATAGDYVVVNYSSADYDPNFGTEEKFEETDVLGDIKKDDDIKVSGVVTGICKQGFILTDKGGSILVYIGKNYDINAYAIGEQLEVSGKVGSYNKGFQLPASSVINKVGKTDVTYPAPVVMTGADIDNAIQRTEDFTAEYVQFTGTLSISGNYYNVNIEGAATATGSLYQFPADLYPGLEDGGKYTFTGYFSSISNSSGAPKFFNILVTEITAAGKSASAPRKVVNVAATDYYAVYKFDGSAWSVPSNVVVLQPSDYIEMGSSYGNLQDDQPERYIPMFMSKKYPYAESGDSKFVVYRYYSNKATNLRCEEYTFDGNAWINSISNGGVVDETNQFVYRNGQWNMDPSIELTLPAGRNQPTSTWFYQAVVDWVNANVPNASNFVDSYGTAEYYSGCSSYQGNVNINTAYAAISGNSDYSGKTQEEIETIMKKRFETETGPGALSTLYPNMAPVGDLQPTVTITFTAWCTGGVNNVYTIVFKCVSKGKFEFESCTWND